MKRVLDKILSGDKQAVFDFYYEFSPKILSYLKKKLPREEDAQEVLQDVFLDALDSLALFEERSSMQTWLYKITRNKIADYYRKRKIKSLLFSQLPFLQFIAHEVTQPEFQYEKNKIREKIEATIHMLSARYRKILKRHYEDGVPIKQIALEMNLSPKATESLLYRARRDFMQKYAKE